MKRILLAIILFPSLAAAQVDIGEVVKSNEGEPINITSEDLVIKNNENLSVFEKNVKVVQGTMTLKANEVKVYSEVDEKTKRSRFKKIEAAGNVDFVSGPKTAKSDHAVYDVKAGTLKLTDNVRLTDSDTVLQGRVFEYNVKTKLTKISNSAGGISASSKTGAKGEKAPVQSGGRAKVVFTPGEDMKTFSTPMDNIGAMRKDSNKTKEKPKP